MPTESNPQFITLWPTLLVRRRLPGHDIHNQGLAALIEQMDRESEQLTTNYLDVDLLNTENDDIRWLRTGIEETVDGYFAEVGIDRSMGFRISAWPNINRYGDYHAPHNHAWSYLSGTYYVKMPGESPPGKSGGQPLPAAISFYDPRAAVNMLAVGNEALSVREIGVRPEAGTVMLWSSALIHAVQPNLSEETRISVSFNISLAGPRSS
jgi:uncharacterized protein (TIGR02466 family)